jgi:hypothetical protein
VFRCIVFLRLGWPLLRRHSCTCSLRNISTVATIASCLTPVLNVPVLHLEPTTLSFSMLRELEESTTSRISLLMLQVWAPYAPAFIIVSVRILPVWRSLQPRSDPTIGAGPSHCSSSEVAKYLIVPRAICDRQKTEQHTGTKDGLNQAMDAQRVEILLLYDLHCYPGMLARRSEVQAQVEREQPWACIIRVISGAKTDGPGETSLRQIRKPYYEGAYAGKPHASQYAWPRSSWSRMISCALSRTTLAPPKSRRPFRVRSSFQE